MENEKPKGGGMEKLASFIVDKRNLFFLLYIFALIFSAIATGWVKVEDDITTYLPDTTETRQGLTVMNDNFVTYGTANVMVSNITYDTALDIQSRLEDIEGVTTVEFDDTDEHYTNASALFSVSFDAEVGDERAENALQEIRDELEGSYDTSIYSEVGYDSSADLQSEMVVIVIIAAIIIVVVLTLTSRSYAEVPVLLMTFGAAALLFYAMWDLNLLDSYMKNRFIVLFDHSYDPLNTGWQQTRSLLTLGGGKIFGQGLFKGVQTQSEAASSLPHRHTDFIFSVIGEELGLVGCLLTLALLTAIVRKHRARGSPYRFALTCRQRRSRRSEAARPGCEVWKSVVTGRPGKRLPSAPRKLNSQMALRKRIPTPAPCHSGSTTRRQPRASTTPFPLCRLLIATWQTG